jgi:hypothetical protein
MTDKDRRIRNRERLKELYPWFRAAVRSLIADLEAKGFRPRIQDAWRSPEDQRVAFEAGRSNVHYGFHNVTGAGKQAEALAVDLLDDDYPTHPRQEYLLYLAAAAESRRLTTGIRWGLPAILARAIDRAIRNEDWRARISLGWDPCHVEPTGLSAAEARRGKRPA